MPGEGVGVCHPQLTCVLLKSEKNRDLYLVEGSYSASVRGERKGGSQKFSQLPHPGLAICREVTSPL